MFEVAMQEKLTGVFTLAIDLQIVYAGSTQPCTHGLVCPHASLVFLAAISHRICCRDLARVICNSPGGGGAVCTPPQQGHE